MIVRKVRKKVFVDLYSGTTKPSHDDDSLTGNAEECFFHYGSIK